MRVMHESHVPQCAVIHSVVPVVVNCSGNGESSWSLDIAKLAVRVNFSSQPVHSKVQPYIGFKSVFMRRFHCSIFIG